MSAAKRNKHPIRAKDPSPKKRPVSPAGVESWDSQTPVWRVGFMDLDGPWSWKCVEPGMWWDTIFLRLRAFESMNWSEIIRNTGSHNVQVNKLIYEARKRLEDINQDDIDALFSLRLSNKQRIWGIRNNRTLRLLWWDPKHEVCKSNPSNT